LEEYTPRGIAAWLDPSEQLGEALFGLIMMLTFTLGSGLTAAEGAEGVRQLLIAALGCNVAWGVIDGVMCVMARVSERSRRLRLHRRLVESKPETALAIVRSELDDTLAPLADEHSLARFYAAVLEHVRKGRPAPGVLRREDLYAGAGAFVLVFGVTLPAVVPFVLMSDKLQSLRASNAVLLVLLFAVGWLWGGWVGTSRAGTAAAMTAIGVALVGVASALGG
jgi:hypothetical protein